MNLIPDVLVTNRFTNVDHSRVLERLSSAADTVQITSPFISEKGCEWLIAAKKNKPQVKVDLITELSVASILSNSLSLEALKELINVGINVRYVTSGLHAKIYIFDHKIALITSANMTLNGLCRNFEIGTIIKSEILNHSTIQNAKSVKDHLAVIWSDIWEQAIPLTIIDIEKLEDYGAQLNLFQDKIKSLEIEMFSKINIAEYSSSPKPIANTRNFPTEVGMSYIFQGFKSSDWDVFDTIKQLSEENLSEYKHRLSISLEPILGKFYKQLIHNSILEDKLKYLDFGFSKNKLVKNFFPRSKYLFLTRPKEGKAKNTHIKIPTIIIGMGVDNKRGKYLEISTGVEEDFVNSLSDAGRNLIEKIFSKRNEYLANLSRLGEGWYFVHGKNKHGESTSIPALKVTSQDIDELEKYIEDNKPADLFIKRRYYLDDAKDRALLESERITSSIIEDFQNLNFFWDLTR